jgi:hypothetical protein
MAIGGEAALKAPSAMRENILTLAASTSQMSPGELDIVSGNIISRHTATS